MQWLRNWLSPRSKSPAQASSASSNGFRPKVESLDDRIVPTVSTAVTAIGTFTLAVNTDHALVALDAAGNQTPTGFTNVRTAQAFRDGDGGLGADIVFQDGSWTHFDASLGGFTTLSAAQSVSQFGGLILDAGTAYNQKGQIRIDFVVSNNTLVDTNGHTFANALGTLMDFNLATGGVLVNTSLSNVLWATPYNAVDGSTGIALGQVFEAGDPNVYNDNILISRKLDSATGISKLYDGEVDGSDAVVEYSQSTALPPINGFPVGTSAASIIDVTFEGTPTQFDPVTLKTLNDGGYALQIVTGSKGSPPDVLDDGIAGVPDVAGVISSNGTIKTGEFYPGAQGSNV